MNNWKKTTLGRVCIDVFSGGTPKSTNNDYYNNGQIPWLNTKEINFNRIFSTEKNITDLGYNNSSTKWVPENSVIVAMYGATAAKVCVNKIKLTTNQACCNLVINKNIADYRYIYYNINNNYIPLSSLANGGAQQNLNSLNIKNFEINLPPLDEQKRIADVLSALDDKIEINNKINENLEAQAQAIFKQWFVDFEFPDAEGKPYKTNGGKFIDSELGEIPVGWKFGTLGENIEIKRGGSPRPIDEYLCDEGLRWLKISDVSGLKTPFIFEIKQCIKHEGLNKTTFLKKGSLVLSNSATPGIPKILAVDSCIHDGWLHFAKSNFSNEFLYLLFLHIKPNLLLQGNGSVFNNLKTDIIKSSKISIPANEVIQSFDLLMHSIFEKILFTTEENKNLSEIRDSLLPKLMNGEVRV